MYMPRISAEGRKRQKQNIQFGGLNRTRAANEGELSDATGVSAKLWPCLTTRSGQTQLRETGQCTALFAWGKLVKVVGSELWYGEDVIGTVTPGEKQFAVVNTKLCIFPDKKYLDLVSKEFFSLEARAAMADNTTTFSENAIQVTSSRPVIGKETLCLDINGLTSEKAQNMKAKRYKEENISWSEADGWVLTDPEEVKIQELKEGDCVMLPKAEIRGDRWIDMNDGNTRPFRTYAAEYDTWGDYIYITRRDWSLGPSANGYIKLYGVRRNAGKTNASLTAVELKVGDAVEISGCVTKPENNRSVIIKSISDTQITFDAPVFSPCDEIGAVTLSRKVPDMDFICESENRLWGVSNKDKTIYTSALGDPTNFYIYAGATVGNSKSSYSVPVGTDGDFTAICAYGSNVLCWKEHCLHKVLGTMPANYEVFTSQIAGVQAGSAGSLQIINEVLYYKGREGVYAYTGSTPQLISAKLAPVEYGEAVAGHTGTSYVISMKRTDTGVWETLSYGTDTGLWLKETEDEALAFANLGGALYLLTPTGILLRGGETDGDGPVPWEAVFVPFTETVHNKKGYSRLLLRLELGEGAWAEADVSTDNGPFRTVWTGHAPCPVSQVIPIRPGRCDRFQVRLRGEGRFVLSSMAREYTLGTVR